MRVPSGTDDLDGIVAQADDGDVHQYQVVGQKLLFLLLLLLHQEVHLQLLEASSSRVDQRHRSDLCNEFGQVVTAPSCVVSRANAAVLTREEVFGESPYLDRCP